MITTADSVETRELQFALDCLSHHNLFSKELLVTNRAREQIHGGRLERYTVRPLVCAPSDVMNARHWCGIAFQTGTYPTIMAEHQGCPHEPITITPHMLLCAAAS
jgi:hypothetical protein